MISVDVQVVKAAPFAPDFERLAASVHLMAEQRDEFAELVRQAEAIAQPRGVYRVAYVDNTVGNGSGQGGVDIADGGVVIDGTLFHSTLLQKNIGAAHRVFPYVATCGPEMAVWAEKYSADPLAQYWADVIMEAALRTALKAVNADMDASFHLGKTAVMNPGSLPDWPLIQQQALFRLLGDTNTTVGVRLTESCLMLPAKSVSGLRWATESGYSNCRLCPRQRGPGRQVPYIPN